MVGTDLITGGAGFIGSELVRQLIAQRRRVLVVDNLETGKAANLDHTGAELVIGDIRDDALMARLAVKVERVFHLACIGVRRSLRDPIAAHDVNATGTLILLESVRSVGTCRFVHVSSSEVYGTALQSPMDDAHPVLPHTVYGASKLAGEAYVRAAHRTHGLSAVIVRPFNAFGPRSHHEGDAGEVIPRFLVRAMAGKPLVIFGDGRQTRDFTQVADTARGIGLAAGPDVAIGETFNLGSGRETAILDLARLVLKVTGSASDIVFDAARPGDVRRLCANSALAQSVLGWQATTTLADGIKSLYDHLRNCGRTPEELLADEVLHNWK